MYACNCGLCFFFQLSRNARVSVNDHVESHSYFDRFCDRLLLKSCQFVESFWSLPLSLPSFLRMISYINTFWIVPVISKWHGSRRRIFSSHTVNALESAQAFTMTFQFNLSCGVQSLNLIILSCIPIHILLVCMNMHVLLNLIGIQIVCIGSSSPFILSPTAYLW